MKKYPVVLDSTLHHSSSYFTQSQYIYLILLASGSRGLDQLLQDSQAHESDVLHYYRCLYVHRHKEQTESLMNKRDITLLDKDFFCGQQQ